MQNTNEILSKPVNSSDSSALTDLEAKVYDMFANTEPLTRSIANKPFRDELNKLTSHVIVAISFIKNEKNYRKIANSDEWKLRLIDYHSQFNLKIFNQALKPSKLLRFLNGEKITMYNYEYNVDGKKVKHPDPNLGYQRKRTHHLRLQGELSVSDLVRFIRAIDYYNKSLENMKEIDKRLKTLDTFFKTAYAHKLYSVMNDILPHEIIELGDQRIDYSNNGTQRQITIAKSLVELNLDLKRLIYCRAFIWQNDCIGIHVNEHRVFTSVKDGTNQLNIISKQDVGEIEISTSKLKPNYWLSQTYQLNLIDRIKDGPNIITFEALSGPNTRRYMQIEYVHSQKDMNCRL